MTTASFSAAFLGADPSALALLPDGFRSAGARARAVEAAAGRTVSPDVLAALQRQAGSRPMSSARARALEVLGQPGTVAVVTGQQVGLFLGPLYSLYKAASAVVTAEALERETGVPCVPVFWLQTEDHDFEEIHHLDVLDGAGVLRRLVVPSAHRQRTSVSCVTLGPTVEPALTALSDALEGAPHRDEVLALLRRHYRPDATWAQAFAGVLSEVLPGLVLLDPRDEAMARQVRHIHQRALDESPAIARALLERHAALEAAGFDVQVHVREDSPLPFFHPGGRDGPRYRVRRTPEGWALVGETGFTGVPEDPLALSTSALLRPIVQDTLLPTAAIVGGPGELNYFAQMPPVYAHFGLPMPLVMPRARFRVVEPRVATLLRRLGLSPADAETPTEALLARLAPRPTPTPEAVERDLLDAVEPLLARVQGVDDAVRRTRGTIARAASRLAGRYARQVRTRDETVVQRLARIQAWLAPGGAPQERVFGFPQLAALHGVSGFTQLVLSSVTPFSSGVADLFPPGAVTE